MKTFNEATNELLDFISSDYANWYSRTEYCDSRDQANERGQEFRESLEIHEGRKYLKVVRVDNQQSVWGFVVKEDDKKFKKGDILLAAGFNAPARNKARGNIFDDALNVRWTGPGYLF